MPKSSTRDRRITDSDGDDSDDLMPKELLSVD
jgi:hypothetical protein